MQEEKFTIKKEHSHLEIAKANRAKWLGQAEKNMKHKALIFKCVAYCAMLFQC